MDVVAAITAVVQQRSMLPDSLNLNIGGAERLSRLDVGQKAAGTLGVSAAAVVGASAATKDVGYNSPPDLAMDSAALVRWLGLTVHTIDDAIARAANYAGG